MMRYAQVGDKVYELMDRDELVEWSKEFKKFTGKDFSGVLTLLCHFNMFDDFLEENEDIYDEYIEFVYGKNELNAIKH